METKKPANREYLQKVRAENDAIMNRILTGMKKLEDRFYSTQELADIFYPVSESQRYQTMFQGSTKTLNINGEHLLYILKKMETSGMVESKKVRMQRQWKIITPVL